MPKVYNEGHKSKIEKPPLGNQPSGGNHPEKEGDKWILRLATLATLINRSAIFTQTDAETDTRRSAKTVPTPTLF